MTVAFTGKYAIPDILDCLIIGGGPAGLTAVLYAARYHLTVAVTDSGQGRAGLINKTHNHVRASSMNAESI